MRFHLVLWALADLERPLLRTTVRHVWVPLKGKTGQFAGEIQVQIVITTLHGDDPKLAHKVCRRVCARWGMFRGFAHTLGGCRVCIWAAEGLERCRHGDNCD